MTRQLVLRRADGDLDAKNRFRQFTGGSEKLQVLQQDAVERVVSSLYPSRAHLILSKYFTIKQKLQEEFGATVELVRNVQGAVRIFAGMEMVTDHKHIDDPTHSLVSGMGFDLHLYHIMQPTEEHFYRVTLGRRGETLELSSLADVAENLLRLGRMLETAAKPSPTRSISEQKQPLIGLRLVGSLAALETDS